MQLPVVNEELYIGNGICADLCPEVFEVRDEKSFVIGPEMCASCDCQEAVDSCPVSAITMKEETCLGNIGKTMEPVRYNNAGSLKVFL